MRKEDYFSRVIEVVADLMDVSEKDILGKSREYEIVDARWMTICLMHEKGYTTKQIAVLMNHPIRTINHSINRFYARLKDSNKHLGNTLATARQQLL